MHDRIGVLVLAAGYGRRLRPLTGLEPKPLLPVVGQPLVGHTLDRLARLGVGSAVLNRHHLGERLEAGLGPQWGEVALEYSVETKLLGTLGALGALRDRFRDASEIIVVNGDSLCRWPLKRLVACHRRWNAAATLLLTSGPDPSDYGGGVGTDPDGRVLSLRGAVDDERITRRRVFAGAHVVSPRLLDRIPDGPAETVPGLWEPLLAEGSVVASMTTRRAWHDLGTPQRYLDGVLDWSRRVGGWAVGRSGWRHPEARAAGSSRCRATVAEAGASVGERTRLDRCVLLGGASVGSGCRLTDVIVGWNTAIPDGTEMAGRLVTRPQAGLEATPNSSRVGDLVLTPL